MSRSVPCGLRLLRLAIAVVALLLATSVRAEEPVDVVLALDPLDIPLQMQAAGPVAPPPASAGIAPQPEGLAVVSQPAFTVPGAVVPLQIEITGTARVGQVWAQYDLERVQGLDSARYRTPQVRGNPGRNLLQWPAPTPRLATDVVWYRVAAEAGGTVLTAPASPLQSCIPYGRWLNAGSSQSVPDGRGVLWEADRAWFPRTYGYDGVTRVITTTRPVRGAAGYAEDDLYQNQRASVGGRPFHCRFYYGPGVYQARLEIELHFAELEATAPGERVFDVLVDGQPLLTGLDVHAAAGSHAAYVVSREVTVTYRLGGDCTLDVAFVPRVGEAAVAGVGVWGLSAIPQYTLTAQVAQGADDAHVVLQDGSFSREPLVRFGRYDDGFEYAGGLLFRQVTLPRGAFISSAWLELWSYPPVGWQYGTADVTVYGQAADSASDFAWNQPKVTVRPLTAQGVRWVIDRTWPAGQACASPDLAAVVQEVIDRPRWRPGNNLAILLMPNGGPIGWRDAVACDWTGDRPPESRAAVLHVTYVPPLHRPASR